jgi:hypothetical protein
MVFLGLCIIDSFSLSTPALWFWRKLFILFLPVKTTTINKKMDLFDALMKDAPAIPETDQDMDFESDLLAQELEKDLESGEENPLLETDQELSKSQKGCFVLIKTAVLGEAAPADLDLSYLVGINKSIHERWQAYGGYQIKFVIDLLNKCVKLSHTHHDSLNNVKCILSGKTFPEQEIVRLVTTLKSGGKPREVEVHKRFLNLCYALFFVLHFKEHLTSLVKADNGLCASDTKADFDCLEACLKYLDHHLPTGSKKDLAETQISQPNTDVTVSA